jgi:hypothetical protein
MGADGDFYGLKTEESVDRMGNVPQAPLGNGAGKAEGLGIVVASVKPEGKGIIPGISAQILNGFAVNIRVRDTIYTLGNRQIVAPPLGSKGIALRGSKGNTGTETVFP